LIDHTPIYWYFDPQAGRAPSGLEGLFSISEMLRLNDMKFELRRKSFIAGRRAAKHLIRHCVSELHDFPPNLISIENRESGAPFVLINDQELPGILSISHCGDAAAVAYTSNSSIQIGIDLEFTTPRPHSFLETFFTPKELDWIRLSNQEDQALISNLIWSAKEAVVKATQTGLRVDTREIEILADISPLVNGWYRFGVNKGNNCTNNWQGFWRKEGEMILTLVVGCDTLNDILHINQISS